MIQRREWKATLMEMLIPMILVAMVALIRTAIKRDDRPDGTQTLAAALADHHHHDGRAIELNLGYKFQYSFVPAWALRLQEVDQVIAFAPDNDISTRGPPSRGHPSILSSFSPIDDE